ncbi:MAG: DUF5655 domain-containing protein [Lysobacterales bacterium]
MASPEEQLQTMVNNLSDKTGKDLDAWLKLLRGAGMSKHSELVTHLKSKHQVTHGFANLIASEFLKTGESLKSPEELVETQYAGPKSALRPIYDTLIGVVERFGNDVALAPKKAYVSLRRNRQFAIIQPSTSSRLDVGINLKNVEPNDRLEAAGSFSAMVSHRVRVEDAIEIDSELKDWLKQAYDQA